MEKETDLIKKYPILKEYKIFECGSYYIELKKEIRTESELEQYINLSDEIFSKVKKQIRDNKNGKRI